MKEKYKESTISKNDYTIISSILSKHMKDGLPQFNKHDWKLLNKDYPKDILREAFIIFIIENECRFPYKIIQYNEVINLFNKLKSTSYNEFIKI